MLITLPNSYGEAATNMAVDASLLETLPPNTSVFRHYGWLEPAVTFGYAQKYQAVLETVDAGLRLVRRLTGGGIVDHRNDWTYSLILQANQPAVNIPATDFYKQNHAALSIALREQSIPGQLAPCPCSAAKVDSKAPDQCFIRPAANDILRPDGRKIAGAAMKRNRHGLLLQGSIDRAALPENFDFEILQQAFVRELSRTFKIEREQPDDLRHLFNEIMIQEQRALFQSTEWNVRR